MNRGENFQKRPHCQPRQKDGQSWDFGALLSRHCSRSKVIFVSLFIWIILLTRSGTSSPASQILKMGKEHAASSLKSWKRPFRMPLRRSLWFQLLPLRTEMLRKKPGNKWQSGERWSVSRRWLIWIEMYVLVILHSQLRAQSGRQNTTELEELVDELVYSDLQETACLK